MHHSKLTSSNGNIILNNKMKKCLYTDYYGTQCAERRVDFDRNNKKNLENLTDMRMDQNMATTCICY